MKLGEWSMMNARAFRGARSAAVRSVVLIACAGTLAGCDSLDSINPFSGEKYKMEVTQDEPADKIYNQALGRIQNKDYEGAAKKFEQLEKQYPSSEWSRKAIIMTAYSNYEGQRYDDAVTAAKRYIQRHPGTKDAAYAQYLLAMSNYHQIPDVTRDQERSEKALVAMQEMLSKYPQSEYVADTKYKMQIARDQLAAKEMEVGRFYLEKRNYTAAINRFRDVVSKYQTTRHVEEALMRLTEAYLSLGITGEAQTAAAVLGHNFPDSPWYKDAYAVLRTGGLEPREDTGSWLSRSFKGVVGKLAGAG
jgi:outer membrane protein assembly factor BamD